MSRFSRYDISQGEFDVVYYYELLCAQNVQTALIPLYLLYAIVLRVRLYFARFLRAKYAYFALTYY